jgi:hypothetical protein
LRMNRHTCHPCGDEIKALNAVSGFAGATIPLCLDNGHVTRRESTSRAAVRGTAADDPRVNLAAF